MGTRPGIECGRFVHGSDWRPGSAGDYLQHYTASEGSNRDLRLRRHLPRIGSTPGPVQELARRDLLHATAQESDHGHRVLRRLAGRVHQGVVETPGDDRAVRRIAVVELTRIVPGTWRDVRPLLLVMHFRDRGAEGVRPVLEVVGVQLREGARHRAV